MNGVDKHHKSQNKIDVMQDIDSVLSNVQSVRQEALLYVFEDNEGCNLNDYERQKSYNEDMFPELTDLLLIGCSIELIRTPKIQIKYIDTKNQLADILIKENFTRDEWNHCC